jgi:Mg-chelatase subunit ChlD
LETSSAANPPTTNNGEALKPLFAVMIIDKSGSMRTLSEATVDGFNEYLTSAQHETPDAIMSVTLFDTTRVELHVAEPIAKIPLLTEERYTRGGMGNTALNDAVGATIVGIESSNYAKNRRILVAVTTDGLENASKEWTRAQVAELVKKKEAAGWKFVFFGANIDVPQEAATMNIPAARAVPYMSSDAGTREIYRKMARASASYAKGDSEEKWSSELSKDR